ncbi:MAG: glycine cleavage T C-terminal barrel domain-containing protein [Nocardioides sp.]
MGQARRLRRPRGSAEAEGGRSAQQAAGERAAASPDHDLIGDEPVYWDGQPLGLVRAGGFGHSLGASCGIAELRRDDPITAADLAAGSFEIDIAGTRVPAAVSLKPLFDPDRTRILC